MRAKEALFAALSFYVDAKKDLPKPSAAKGRKLVSPAPLVLAKLALYQAMRESGVKKAELTRRLGWNPPQVDRVLDLYHASQLSQIEAALYAVGLAISALVDLPSGALVVCALALIGLAVYALTPKQNQPL